MSNDREQRRYGEHPSQFVDVAIPPGEPCGVVLSLHGGYWRDTYGLDLHDRIVDHCNTVGWAVVNAEYRRITPSETDVWDAMAEDLHHCALISRGIAGARPLVALGHSAGGHLALWLTAQREVAIDAVVALAPVTDLVEADRRQLSNGVTTELFGASSEEQRERYEDASPFHQLPLGVPQLVVHGPLDQHVPYDMVVDYVDAARSLDDTVELVNSNDIDHFNVIDPDHDVWRKVDAFLSEVRQGEN